MAVAETLLPWMRGREVQILLQRRLLIGGIGTILVVALSLLPTDSLRLSRPSKPLFFYLVPLVRVQALLKDLEGAAIDGRPEGEQLMPKALPL